MSRPPLDLSPTHGTWQGEEILHPGPGVPERVVAEGHTVITPILGGEGTASDYEHRRDGAVAMRGHIVVIPSSRDEDDVSMHWMSAVARTVVFRGRFRDGVFQLKTEIDGVIQRLEQDFSEEGRLRVRTRMGTDPENLSLAFEADYRRVEPARPGTIGWHDLTVDDAPRLRDFYAAVVGWTPEPVPMGGYDDFTMVAADGSHVAGVCHARGGNAGLPPVWMTYVHVDDIDASLARARELGGSVEGEVRSMGADRYAVVRDPAGAFLSLYQAG